MIAVLFVALIILTSANLAGAALSAFWADCGACFFTRVASVLEIMPAISIIRNVTG